jgi:hypothetical protein
MAQYIPQLPAARVKIRCMSSLKVRPYEQTDESAVFALIADILASFGFPEGTFVIFSELAATLPK